MLWLKAVGGERRRIQRVLQEFLEGQRGADGQVTLHRRGWSHVQVDTLRTQVCSDRHVPELWQTRWSHQDVRTSRVHHGQLRGHDAQVSLIRPWRCEYICPSPYQLFWFIFAIELRKSFSKIVFTARRYASMVYAVVVCLSVRLSICHKPALYQNG